MTWSKNLTDYVKVYPGWCDEKVCQETVDELERNESLFQTHAFYNSFTDSRTSYNNELSVLWADTAHKRHIEQRVWDALRRYHDELIEAGCTWYDGWQNFTAIRFNRYKENTQMKLHCDHIHSMFDGTKRGIPVLSIVGTLNDNYSGGRFVFFGDTPMELKTGSLMIFPSNFLYPHHVEMVTEGTRYSFVSWTC